jgi:polysaccharide export outer membrane protein
MPNPFPSSRQAGRQRYRALICSILLFLIFGRDSLSAQNPGLSPAQPPNAQIKDAPIIPGDQISIAIFDTPELSGPMRVRNDGTIDFPLLGSIPVSGMNLSSAANLIRDRLISGNFMKDPQVNVSFLDYSNHFATVLGEVSRPGPIPLVGIRSVWDIIGAAGGVTPTAGSRITIFHGGDTLNASVYNVNWGHDLQGQANPTVSPGDTIQVSRAGVVYVLGEVTQQGGYPITHQSLTVAQAIALAGGIKYTSKAGKSQWVHTAGAQKVVTQIDVPSILKGKSPDIILHEDDVLYVPNSVAKVAIIKGLQAAVSITSAVIIYKNQ